MKILIGFFGLFHFVIIIVFISSNSFAQAPLVKKWDNRYGGTQFEEFNSIQETNDGGFIIGGYTLSEASGDITFPKQGGPDYWIIKIDSIGNKQWDRRFGDLRQEFLSKVIQTSDGGYILGGNAQREITSIPLPVPFPLYDDMDIWIIKLDSIGNIEWEKKYGGDMEDSFTSFCQTSDGGYIIGAASESGISGDKTQTNWDSTFNTNDYWIIKIDSIGNKIWDKRFGGTNSDYLSDIKQTADGGFIIGGSSFSGISGDKTQANRNLTLATSDYWLIKTNSNGNMEWDKVYGGIGYDGLISLLITSDGGYILGGISDSIASGDKTHASRGFSDYWLVKTDKFGNKEWDQLYGGTGREEFFSLEQTLDKGYILSGDSYSPAGADKSENNLGSEQAWVVKTDYLGNKEWDKTILTTGHDESCQAIQTSDSCYVIANTTNAEISGDKTVSNWGSGEYVYHDFWVVKFCDTSRHGETIQIGIFKHIQKQAKIYPNPTQNTLHIETSSQNQQIENIQIISLSGKNVVQTNQTSINTSELSQGIYFYQVEMSNGELLRGKFVKE